MPGDIPPRLPLPLVPLHDLLVGQMAETFALFTERKLGRTREGKPYVSCHFADRFRTVSAMIWAESPWLLDCEKAWVLGQAYCLTVTYSHHDRYGPQIEIHKWRNITAEDRHSGFDLANLVDSTRFHIPDLWTALLALVEKEIAQPALKKLILTLYEQHAAQLQTLPATEGKFYPFRGGWLEHVLSLARSCLLLVDHYRSHYQSVEPALDRDLVLAGALLHDIGRVREFSTDPLGILLQPTVPGKLFGHMTLGRDLVRETALALGELPLPYLERLEHVILSHLVHPEWGSPRLPMLPEVLILHHADDLDAKLEMYLRCLSRDQGAGPFTARDPVLGKALLKPDPVPLTVTAPADNSK
jgi:3'-5' exoribonuclease